MVDDEDTCVTFRDVERTLISPKNRKAAGCDRIVNVNELSKYGGNCLMAQLTKLFNNINKSKTSK